MKLKNISIKYSYTIILILAILPIFIIYTWLHYSGVREGIIQNAQIAVNQSQQTVTNTISITEKSYEFVSLSYDELMKKCLIDFERAYEVAGGKVELIDLEHLKNKYDGKMDLYIINKDGVITHSTFPLALGIDFSNMPNFLEYLEAIRLGDEIFISRVTSDLRTKELRKWGYIPTVDHQYTLEVGIAADELSKYIKGIDYVEIEKSIMNNNPYVKKLRVYDMNDVALGYEEETVPEAKTKILDEIFEKGANFRVIGLNSLIEREYIYLNTFDDDLEESKKIIEIEYDNHYVMDMINKRRNTIIVLMIAHSIISLLVIIYMTNRFITKPLILLTSKIDNIDVSNLEIDLPFTGDNEIGKLVLAFNKASQKVISSRVSKQYLENVLDSVGDIVILLDEALNIQQINKHGKKLLGCDEAYMSNRPMTDLLCDENQMIGLREGLEREKTIVDFDMLLCAKEGLEIDILSTWSTLDQEDGSIKGYVCNAKNVTRTKKIMRELTDRSTKDYLTGAYNRRFMLEKLNQLVSESPSQEVFSILMMDIDYFKDVNDSYGHLAGDQVLIKLTEIISSVLRNSDYLCRYGGEEFLIVLPETGLDTAKLVAERIRNEVEITVFLEEQISITISGGVAEWTGEGIDQLIEKADRHLYHSKLNGRNQITS
jgi:diguanylate cyclase (GGDEF)-like protein/PAS domain S-box-containing protein